VFAVELLVLVVERLVFRNGRGVQFGC
jgi:hypothetical protein